MGRAPISFTRIQACTMPTTSLQTLCLLQYAQAILVHIKMTLGFLLLSKLGCSGPGFTGVGEPCYYSET